MNQYQLDTLFLVCLLKVNASTCFGRYSPIFRRLFTDVIWCNYVRRMRVDYVQVAVEPQPQSYRGMIWQHLKTGHDLFLSHSFQIVFTTWMHKPRVTVFCTVAPNVFGPSLWNMLHVTLPASIILRWLLDFRKVRGFLIFSDIIIYYFLLYFWSSVLKFTTH
jgi:hypothetical protein